MGYEIKARSTTELMDGAFQLYRNHFQVFATLVLPVYGAMFGLTGAVNRLLTGHFILQPSKTAAAAAHHVVPVTPPMSKHQMYAIIINVLIAVLGGFVSHFLLTIAVSMAFRGETLTAATVLERAGGMFGRYFAAAFKVSLLSTLGFFLFIVPGVLMGLDWMLVTPVVVFEGDNVNPLDRSKTLIHGSRGRIATILFVVGFIVGIAGAGTAGITNGISPFLALSLQSLLQAFTVPITPCLLALAYIDCRVRKEGYDMEVRAQQTASQAPVGALA